MSDWAGYAEPAGNADMSRHDAVVVGSGPNGLAAAITLALAGRSVLVLEAKPTPGGGMRTAELTLPGFRHDVCAAIHPMGAAGSFFSDIGVDVAWCHPEVPMAHPLDDGTAAVLLRSVGETADANDSPRWRRYVEPVAQRWGRVESDLLGAPADGARHPLGLMRLDGIRAAGCGAAGALEGLIPLQLLAVGRDEPCEILAGDAADAARIADVHRTEPTTRHAAEVTPRFRQKDRFPHSCDLHGCAHTARRATKDADIGFVNGGEY